MLLFDPIHLSWAVQLLCVDYQELDPNSATWIEFSTHVDRFHLIIGLGHRIGTHVHVSSGACID